MSSEDNHTLSYTNALGKLSQEAVDGDKALVPNFAETDTPASQAAVDRGSASPQKSSHTPPHSPPRRDSADAGVPIDPNLLAGDSTPYATAPQSTPIQPPDEQWKNDSTDPVSTYPSRLNTDYAYPAGSGLTPWALNTSLEVTESQPNSNSPSPASPIGLGVEGLYHGRDFELSRPSSVTDLDSYVGATKGETTTGSGDSLYEAPTGGFDELSDTQSGVGIPPPKPKKSHARKQPPGHIKRARNAFILFRKHITDSNLIPPSVEVKHQNISVVAAKMWREAPQEVRQKFQEQARLEKEEHQRKYPGYRYQPVFRRTDIIRRRVRKDVAEDEKVEAVAEALIKGKSGGELEKEIKDQLVARSEASDSEAESSRGSRRRRRDVGQLSKGAIRAQRAKARATQMRQSLLGSNLLNMSLYNAAAQGRGIPSHPGAQHHLQYDMVDPYMPVGYDLEGRPVGYPNQGIYGAAPMDAGDMYRLPPIGSMSGYDSSTWQAGQSTNEYWPTGGDVNGQAHSQGYYHTDAAGPSTFAQGSGHPAPGPQGDYQMARLTEASDSGNNQPPGMMNKQPDPRLTDWVRDGQQTPSGHVLFNERLFDGALGSAGLPALGDADRDDGLAGFEEAIAQVNDMSQW